MSSLGFYENQASELLRKRTSIIGLTEEKIKLKVDFLVKTVGLPLIDLIRYLGLFGLSLETMMVPRYRVLKEMESMQVQVSKRRFSFPNIFRLTEKNFLEKYIESSSFLQAIYSRDKDGNFIMK